ncbi:polyphosphate polymerase domain-containing protein [Rummeliibacillus pycnus]|uniref:polyphosphate polymerase domain-containing protein n=1 Tax=Rummeliibacillus pycnus TaxID=101070 RepID=UPI000C999FEB|nr:polyphosphate polymerase domain-containing protein [Rummeliibacillus pycnus]
MNMNLEQKTFRHELKYYLNKIEYIALRKKVSEMLTLDKNSVNEEGYHISSLYFDGMHNHSIYDKNNGIFHREKYRIRIYNGSDKKITLERKSKHGDFICKESASITRTEYDSILNGDIHVLADKEEKLLTDFKTGLCYRNFRPVVIVDYIREAYVYEPGNVRITFDKQLTAGLNTIDLFDENIISQEVLLPEQVILEVKFDHFLPDMIRKIVQPERLVRSAISKYVLCRELTIKNFK